MADELRAAQVAVDSAFDAWDSARYGRSAPNTVTRLHAEFVDAVRQLKVLENNGGVMDEYCDYCEREGHTFRSCAARDDDFTDVEEDVFSDR